MKYLVKSQGTRLQEPQDKYWKACSIPVMESHHTGQTPQSCSGKGHLQSQPVLAPSFPHHRSHLKPWPEGRDIPLFTRSHTYAPASSANSRIWHAGTGARGSKAGLLRGKAEQITSSVWETFKDVQGKWERNGIRIGCGRPGWRHAEERGQKSWGTPGAWTGLQTHCRAWPGSVRHGAVSNEPAWEIKKTVWDWAEFIGKTLETPRQRISSPLHTWVWVSWLPTGDMHWGTGLAFLSHLWAVKFSFWKCSCPSWWEKDGSCGNPAVLGLWCNAGAIRLTPSHNIFLTKPVGCKHPAPGSQGKGCCRFSRRLGSFQLALEIESDKE